MMRCLIVLSAGGVEALESLGVSACDLVIARGAPALTAARAKGWMVVSADSQLDGIPVAEVDGPALVAARTWRPGPISARLPWLDLGILAEYDVWNAAARCVRLAATLDRLPPVAELAVAAPPGSAEALVAGAVAEARGIKTHLVPCGEDSVSQWDIAARAVRPPSLGRRLAKYWLARLATVGFSRGDRVAAYTWGEAGHLIYALARAGVIRPMLDPVEPPPREAYLSGSLSKAGWAGGTNRRVGHGSGTHLPSPPALSWRGIDLSGSLAAAMEAVVAPQVRTWECYALDLLASWSRARIRSVILSNDCTAFGRTRSLVAERLGASSIVVQHGVLEYIADRNHEVADYSAVWGPLAARDLVDRGVDGDRLAVVGWPAGNLRLAQARSLRAEGVGPYALLLTTTLASFTAAVPDDSVEDQATTAVEAIRGAGWSGRVVAKIHPGQNAGVFRELFAAAGHPDVEVVGGRADTWLLMARARLAVTVSSSIACALPPLGCPSVVYERMRLPYAPYMARFREFATTTDQESAQTAVGCLLRGDALSGNPSGDEVMDYAALVNDGPERFAQQVRQAVRSGPVGPGAMNRALDGARSKPVAFDRLPLASAAAVTRGRS